eukprot:TRINITY_DN10163_c0_g2_i14.p1 TRINITY_DN10163_c0_g2~~TRINITY_DN10163_c0_g2_i14.p1  ORF type:complete len:152 (+),score=35.78 TRINITY_DN10163_c0_g2_i14:61-516(+)
MSAEEFKEAGNKKFGLRDFESAERLYTKAIELDPEQASYYCNRASTRLALGWNSKALDDADKALKLDPSYSKAYYRRGVANLALGNLSEALVDFETTERREPSNLTREKVDSCSILFSRRLTCFFFAPTTVGDNLISTKKKKKKKKKKNKY